MHLIVFCRCEAILLKVDWQPKTYEEVMLKAHLGGMLVRAEQDSVESKDKAAAYRDP
jgi:hypothetical protein